MVFLSFGEHTMLLPFLSSYLIDLHGEQLKSCTVAKNTDT